MIVKNIFGTTADGRAVDCYTIKNSSGMAVDIITYGATVNSIYAEDKNGVFADVLAGFDSIDGHENHSDYEGMTVGRYANRIANGKFSIDGVEYNVEKNEKGITCLHGGAELSTAVWKAIVVDDNAVEMTYTSPDGAMGFPGKVDFKVTFTLHEDNALKIEYFAVSDKKTVINMTNHAYFNLAGKGDVLGHELMINADAYTPIDENSIPTGEIRPVEGTPFDFREFKAIGRDIAMEDDQLAIGKGYDHNWCLNNNGKFTKVIEMSSDVSGITMEAYTDLPGVHVYSGNYLREEVGKQGIIYKRYQGICFETQHYPDAINHENFPSVILKPEEPFRSKTLYHFSNF